MTSLNHLMAALVVALAPTAALAQTAIPNPAVPGSGYQIPEVHTKAQVGQQPEQAANDANLGKPGDGYQIPQVASPSAQRRR